MATGQALETLRLAGAYRVSYREVFHTGDIHSGSYVPELHLSDPDGFTITAGGPGPHAPGRNPRAQTEARNGIPLGTFAECHNPTPLRFPASAGRHN